MPIAMSTVITRAETQVSCQLNGAAAVLSLKSSLYFGLNEVGAFIWKDISEPKAIGKICDNVAKQFAIDKEQCEVDVIEFISNLSEAGLIDCHESAGCQDERQF